MILFFLYFSTFVLIVKASVLEILPRDGFTVRKQFDKYSIKCISNDVTIRPKDLKWIDNNNITVRFNNEANLSTVWHELVVDGSILHFDDLDRYDIGPYRCCHANHYASYDILVYKLEVQSVKHVYFKLDSTAARINIEYDIYPDPTVVWIFNHKSILSGDKYILKPKSLVVKNVKKSDAGIYTCAIKLPERYNISKEIQVTVAVEEEARVVGGPEEVVQLEGTDLNLTWQVEGTCPCKYRFFLEGEELGGSERVSMEGGQLFFSPVRRSDQGNISVEVTNNVGKHSFVTRLTVHITPKIVSFESTICKQGTRCEMRCLAEGSPRVVVNVTKGVDETPVKLMETTRDSYSFWFNEVAPDHADNFTCSAISSLGRDLSEAALEVQYKPRAVPDQMRRIYTWPMHTVNLSCQADAVPTPHFTWISWSKNIATDTKNHDVFTIFDTVQTSQTTYLSILQLFMHPLKFNLYFNPITCIVENKIGKEAIIINVKKANIPNLCLLKAHAVYPEEVWLELEGPKEDGNDALLGFNIKYGHHSVNFSLDDTIRLTGLKPGEKYYLRYNAFNRVGLGVEQIIRLSTTKPCKPFTLTITSANVSDSSSYDLKWDRPIAVGSPIQLFTVMYRKVNGDSELREPLHDWVTKKLQGATHTGTRLTSLDHHSSYQVLVTATNQLGVSEPHQQFYFQTPRAVVGASEYSTNKEDNYSEGQASKGSPGSRGGLVFFLVLLVLVIFFVLVDGSCYYLKGRSLTAALCTHLRGHRKQLFRKEVSDSKNTPHSNSKHLLQPEGGVGGGTEGHNNSLNNNKLLRQGGEVSVEVNNHLISSSVNSDSTLKSENFMVSNKDDSYIANGDLGTFDEEEDEGGGRSYIT